MPEQPQQSSDSVGDALPVIFFQVAIFLAAGMVLVLFPAFISLQFEVNFFLAFLLVLLVISIAVFISWWLSGRTWFVRLLNKMARQDVFMVRGKDGRERVDEHASE